MSKPSKLPEWASSSDNIEEPEETKKEEGWLEGQPVVSSIFNWILSLTYSWLSYLEDWTDNHNHKDDGSEGSTAQISLPDELDWGSPRPGYLESNTLEGGDIHQIVQETDDAQESQFTTDIVRCEQEVELPGSFTQFNSFGDPATFTDTVDAEEVKVRHNTQETNFYEILQLDNLVKGHAEFQFAWEGDGLTDLWSITVVDEYGLDTSETETDSVDDSEGSFDFNFLLAGDDASDEWQVTTTLGGASSSQDEIISSEVQRISGGGGARATVWKYEGGGSDAWNNWLQNPSTGDIFNISVVVL